MKRGFGLLVVVGAVLLALPACTNSVDADGDTVPENSKSIMQNNTSFDISRWAVPVSGTIPFNADAQNLLSERHRDLLGKIDIGPKDDSSPKLYVVKAVNLAALQAGLDAQAPALNWTRVEMAPPTLQPGGLADQLAGSWGQVWRLPEGGAIIVAGLTSDRANDTGDLPVLIDRVD